MTFEVNVERLAFADFFELQVHFLDILLQPKSLYSEGVKLSLNFS